MDTASQDVTQFLEALQDNWTKLGEVSNPWRAKWVSIAKPGIFLLSGRPFTVWQDNVAKKYHGCITLGIHTQDQPLDKQSIEFEIRILWDELSWYIQTEVYRESDEGVTLLRTFPERHTTDLRNCLQFVKLAIDDLATCEDLLMSIY